VSTLSLGSRKRTTFADVRIGDFSGGLNLRDALTELAPNETPDCLNVVLDERGGVNKRLGYVRWNATALPVEPEFGYASAVCGCNLWYCPDDGKLYRDVNGTLTNVKTFSISGNVSIVDFVGATYLMHMTDGLWRSTDGTTWTKVVATSGSVPVGDQLAVWQNKLWVANSTTTLLSYCAPGDPAKWNPTDNAGANYIREGNDFPIVCLYGTSGVDFTAHPALLVGKRSGSEGSMHRVTDASTANYVTIDQSAAPGGPGSITNIYGYLYVIGPLGIFKTDGQSPLQPISQKLGKLFTPDAIDYTRASEMVAARTADGRLRFSFTQKGETGNDRTLEYHPLFDAFTMRDDAACAYLETLDGRLLGASPSSPGRIWYFDSGGADDGANIASRILTGVFEPGGGYEARLQHIRVTGRGTFTLGALPDFAAGGKEKVITLAAAAGLQWDVNGWDDPGFGWGEAANEGTGNFWPRLEARSFQVKLSESSTVVSVNPPLNEGGVALPSGGWACYGLRLSFTPLSPS
jgi:hypothetical protein